MVADEKDMEIRGAARLLRPLPVAIMVSVFVLLIVGATLVTVMTSSNTSTPPSLLLLL